MKLEKGKIKEQFMNHAYILCGGLKNARDPNQSTWVKINMDFRVQRILNK